MTTKQTCVADADARVILPSGFANATLIVEQLSDVEIRIRKKDAIQGDETEFAEERITMLSDRDRDRFLQLLENPPEPNAALRKAMGEHRKRHG